MSSSLRRDFMINLASGPRPPQPPAVQHFIRAHHRSITSAVCKSRLTRPQFHLGLFSLSLPLFIQVGPRHPRDSIYSTNIFAFSAPTLTDKECRRVSDAHAGNANTSRQGRLFTNILGGDDFIFTNLTVSDKFLDLSDDKCP